MLCPVRDPDDGFQCVTGASAASLQLSKVGFQQLRQTRCLDRLQLFVPVMAEFDLHNQAGSRAFRREYPLKGEPTIVSRSILPALLLLTLSFCLPPSVLAQHLEVVVMRGGQEQDTDVGDVHFDRPFGIGFDRKGNYYTVAMEGNQVCRHTPETATRRYFTVLAGTGMKGNSGDGGDGRKALLNGPHHLLVLPSGDVYIADTWNNRIRKIDARTGRITAFAGTGQKGASGDGGPASAATFGGIYCLALDAARQNLYVDDLDNHTIRKIALKTGLVSTIAGNGKSGAPHEGAEALTGPLLDPRAIALDSKGNLYILERSGNVLRMVDGQGKIHTVVGTGKAGPSADDVPALQATLRGPKHLCVDGNDNVFIADTDNHVIRKYLPQTGRLIRIAGTGIAGSAGADGSPLLAQLNQPHGVYVDPRGVLYISDSWNDRIVKIVP
jgi:DNA-binding beta-propeller fold protein YncE